MMFFSKKKLVYFGRACYNMKSWLVCVHYAHARLKLEFNFKENTLWQK